ncbi:hypothetical protein IE53DRAFT_162481 [Violaceomyces palustris]|uniref:Uncharacterized protein n=1 Tax=Violaceomyces palustris TaxID=1673888 RepID=A0ACD0NTJ9_9BASI|nr:hypothetical protein IE53DRAFT_162481 [Violaceomyces palustris]
MRRDPTLSTFSGKLISICRGSSPPVSHAWLLGPSVPTTFSSSKVGKEDGEVLPPWLDSIHPHEMVDGSELVHEEEQGKVRRYTLVFPIHKDTKGETRLLLGLKKRGFGTGTWNGFGGKVEDKDRDNDSSHREEDGEGVREARRGGKGQGQTEALKRQIRRAAIRELEEEANISIQPCDEDQGKDGKTSGCGGRIGKDRLEYLGQSHVVSLDDEEILIYMYRVYLTDAEADQVRESEEMAPRFYTIGNSPGCDGRDPFERLPLEGMRESSKMFLALFLFPLAQLRALELDGEGAAEEGFHFKLRVDYEPTMGEDGTSVSRKCRRWEMRLFAK